MRTCVSWKVIKVPAKVIAFWWKIMKTNTFSFSLDWVSVSVQESFITGVNGMSFDVLLSLTSAGSSSIFSAPVNLLHVQDVKSHSICHSLHTCPDSSRCRLAVETPHWGFIGFRVADTRHMVSLSWGQIQSNFQRRRWLFFTSLWIRNHKTLDSVFVWTVWRYKEMPKLASLNLLVSKHQTWARAYSYWENT